MSDDVAASLDEASEVIQYAATLYMRKRREDELKNLRQTIHDIVFDAREQIPENIYIRLMNAIRYS
jgi:hypothetical protein